MTRTDSPRSRLLVMAILTLSLGLALALWAQPEGDAAEPRDEAVASPLIESLREGVRLLGPGERTSFRVHRLVPSTTGEVRVLELGRPGIATCLAQPAGAGPDLCRVGEAMSRMPACVEPGDCPAYEAWTQLFGEPRPRPARPEPAAPPRDAAEEPE